MSKKEIKVELYKRTYTLDHKKYYELLFKCDNQFYHWVERKNDYENAIEITEDEFNYQISNNYFRSALKTSIYDIEDMLFRLDLEKWFCEILSRDARLQIIIRLRDFLAEFLEIPYKKYNDLIDILYPTCGAVRNFKWMFK